MSALHHTPAPREVRDDAAERYNARLGMGLFAVYLVAYVAFVVINAFWPAAMDRVVFAGLNLAVVWGLGLIVGALALALVYACLCRSPAGGPRP